MVVYDCWLMLMIIGGHIVSSYLRSPLGIT